MEFFEKLGKKASDTFNSAAEITNKIASETKIKFKINDCKSKIKDLYLDIGKIVYQKFALDGKLEVKEEIEEQLSKISEYKNQILDNPKNYELFDEIFFFEIPKMSIYTKIKKINVVGGLGKKLAIDTIIDRDKIDSNNILYIGDSITDVEPLQFARENEGISISFNGNEYPLKVAQIAIVSPSAITTAVIADIYANNDKNKVLDFINKYNSSTDIKELFDEFNINQGIKNKFFEVFDGEDYPIIKEINDNNYNEILKKSVNMRNNIRGEDIGGLG